MDDFEEDLESLEDYCEQEDQAYLDRLEEEFFRPPGSPMPRVGSTPLAGSTSPAGSMPLAGEGAPEEEESPFGELEDMDEIGEG